MRRREKETFIMPTNFVYVQHSRLVTEVISYVYTRRWVCTHKQWRRDREPRGSGRFILLSSLVFVYYQYMGKASDIAMSSTALLPGTTQDHLQIFNIELKAKIKSYQMPEQWITPKLLGLVTQASVYHWSIEGMTKTITTAFDGSLHTSLHYLQNNNKLVMGTGNGSLRTESPEASFPSLISTICSCGSDKMQAGLALLTEFTVSFFKCSWLHQR